MASFEIVFFSSNRPVYHRIGSELITDSPVTARFPVDIFGEKRHSGTAYYLWTTSPRVPIDGLIFVTVKDLREYCKTNNVNLGVSHYRGCLSLE